MNYLKKLLIVFSWLFYSITSYSDTVSKEWGDINTHHPMLDGYMLSEESPYAENEDGTIDPSNAKKLHWGAKIFAILDGETDVSGFKKAERRSPLKLKDLADAENDINTSEAIAVNLLKTIRAKTKATQKSLKQEKLLSGKPALKPFSKESMKEYCPNLVKAMHQKDAKGKYKKYKGLYDSNVLGSGTTWRQMLRFEEAFLYKLQQHEQGTGEGVEGKHCLAFTQAHLFGFDSFLGLIYSNIEMDKIINFILDNKSFMNLFTKVRIPAEMREHVEDDETTVAISLFPLIMSLRLFDQQAELLIAWLQALQRNESILLPLYKVAPCFTLFLCASTSSAMRINIMTNDDELARMNPVQRKNNRADSVKRLKPLRDDKQQLINHFPYITDSTNLDLKETQYSSTGSNLQPLTHETQLEIATRLAYALIHQTALKPRLWGRVHSNTDDKHKETVLLMLEKVAEHQVAFNQQFSPVDLLHIHAAMYEYPTLVKHFAPYCENKETCGVVMQYLLSMTAPLTKGETLAQRAEDMSQNFALADCICKTLKPSSEKTEAITQSTQPQTTWGGAFSAAVTNFVTGSSAGGAGTQVDDDYNPEEERQARRKETEKNAQGCLSTLRQGQFDKQLAATDTKRHMDIAITIVREMPALKGTHVEEKAIKNAFTTYAEKSQPAVF